MDSDSDEDNRSSICSQTLSLMLFMLRLKLKGVVFAVVPVLALLSGMLQLATKQLPTQKWTGEPEFFRSADLIASHRVLVDGGAFSTESGRLRELAKSMGVDSPDWLVDCQPAASCSRQLIGETDSRVIGYLKPSTSGSSAPPELECFDKKFSNSGPGSDSAVTCAFLYQLVAQALRGNRSGPGLFKSVEFFQAQLVSNSSNLRTDDGLYGSLPKSACLDWMKVGNFKQVFDSIVSMNLLFSLLAITIYFMMTTLYHLNSMKRVGFLMQLFRNGMSVTAYWIVVWLVALAECTIFAVILVLSYVLQCPGVFPAAQMVKVFIMSWLSFLTFAGLGFLVLTLTQSLVSLLSGFVAIAMFILFKAMLAEATLYSRDFLNTHVTPVSGVIFYIQSVMTSDFVQTTGGVDATAKHPAFFKAIIPLTAGFLVLLALGTIYLDFTMETGNGFQLPLDFLLNPSFWSPSSSRTDSCQSGRADPPSVEAAVGLGLSVQASDLCKTYVQHPNCFIRCCKKGSSNQVLKNFSGKIYSGQITALIGHNGAGKSTLQKILTGHVTPTSGSAVINGILVTDPVRRLALRGKLGVCEQSDILCDSLTVMESISITLMSRGSSMEAEGDEARELLRRLGLGDKEQVLTYELSGGQKRKLCTILSLLGDPEVVFLDEPTSGLDPVSRRQLWQLLQEFKAGRTIVLCTQFMDEADVLADRKLIMVGGELVCAGSSMFLKRSFGCALTLSVSLKSADAAQQLMASLQGACRLKRQAQTELELQVPATDPDALVRAVKVLEGSQQIVEAFGLSQANLDDIFMKLHGVNASFIVDAFRLGSIGTFATREDGFQPGEESAGLGRADPSHTARPQTASLVQQVLVLLPMNFLRQMGTVSGNCSRFNIVVIILAMLGLTMSLSPGGGKKESQLREKLKSNAATLSPEEIMFLIVNTTNVRLLDSSGLTGLRRVCIGDEAGTNLTDVCSRLTGMGPQFQTLSKPAAVTLQDFLSRVETRERLQKFCKFLCAIVYAASWNGTGGERSVSIGTLTTGKYPGSLAYVYRLAFVSVANWFQPVRGSEAAPRLTLLVPRSQFSPPSLMYLLYLAAALVSFASPIAQDPIKDLDGEIRPQLATMGMSRVAYWVSMFTVHLCQYVICGVLAAVVPALFLAGTFGNWFFGLAVMLTSTILGGSVHQLIAYTFAATVRRSIIVLMVLHQLYVSTVAVIMLLLMGAGRLGVLLGIWLIPHLAPVAFIFYAVPLAIHSKLYYELDSVDKVPGLLAACWNSEYVRHSILAMLLHIPLYCLLLTVADHQEAIAGLLWRLLGCAKRSRESSAADAGDRRDSRVLAEAARVTAAPRSRANVLEVSGLCKTHSNGVRAVRGVTFAARAGEVLGLLGPNGAGKSTTLSVVVGQEVSSSGSCEVQNYRGEWHSGASGAGRGDIGFCPQHNPLFSRVSVQDHLQFYGRLRGVSPTRLGPHVDHLIAGLGLTANRETAAKQLSGGNKRRLCLALALLGDPALVVIDEASTGVDPANKRFIWSAIRAMVHDRRSVLLTSHSMEEVEALCTRVGVMSRGRMIAFGTAQQLRSVHGDAFTLDILLQASSPAAIASAKAAVHQALSARFPGTSISDSMSRRVQFQLPKRTSGKLSDALLWLKEKHAGLGIEFYSLYQMSLDQVFVAVIRQSDGDGSVHV